MKNTEFDRLSKIIQGGRSRYILVFGVVFWGLLSAIIVVLIRHLTKESLSLKDYIVPFITFPICGMGWGYAMWSGIKKRHDKLKLAEQE